MHQKQARLETFQKMFVPFSPAATAQILEYLTHEPGRFRGYSKRALARAYVLEPSLTRYDNDDLRTAIKGWVAAHCDLEYAEDTERHAYDTW